MSAYAQGVLMVAAIAVVPVTAAAYAAWSLWREKRRQLEARGTLAMETLAWSLAIRAGEHEAHDFAAWENEMAEADL